MAIRTCPMASPATVPSLTTAAHPLAQCLRRLELPAGGPRLRVAEQRALARRLVVAARQQAAVPSLQRALRVVVFTLAALGAILLVPFRTSAFLLRAVALCVFAP